MKGIVGCIVGCGGSVSIDESVQGDGCGVGVGACANDENCTQVKKNLGNEPAWRPSTMPWLVLASLEVKSLDAMMVCE